MTGNRPTGAYVDIASLPYLNLPRPRQHKIARRKQIQDLIQRLDRRVVRGCNPDDLLESLGILTDSTQRKAARLEEVTFYRARRISSRLFDHINELRYPPAPATPKGRLNRKGDPMFYAAYSPAAALVEARAVAGRIIIVATIEELHEDCVQFFPIGISSGRYATPSREPAERLVIDYLNREMTKTVYTGNEYEYSSTIAIADLFLHKPAYRKGVRVETGLIYPSVRAGQPLDEGTYNIALTPEVFDAYYRITEVKAYYVSIPPPGAEPMCEVINRATV
ncbi:MAG: RES family NAD+ phosphorylase, partial [Burkholderiales bacterium]